jgi:PAS domain S-box-containing protein
MKSSVFEKGLSRSKKMWRGKSQIDFLVQNIPDPFNIIDFNGYVLDVNPAFERVYGWKKKEVIQKYIPLVPPRLTTDFFSFLKKIRQNEKVSGYQAIRLCKDRSEIEVSIDAFLIMDRKGRPAAIGEISRNITHLKRKESLAKKFQERWRTLTHNAPHLIITVDREGVITFANQRIKQLLGYDVEEIMNSSLSTLIADEDLEAAREDIIEVIAKDQMKSCVYRLKQKNGSMPTYAIDWSPLKESSGKVVGAVGMARDITREKEKEAELVQSQRLEALTDFVGGIAHHFNNLMTVIVLESDIIGKAIREQGDEVIEERLKLISESCFRGTQKIDRILEFIEGLSGKQFLMVDIDGVVKQVLSQVSVYLRAKTVQVNTKWGKIAQVLGCSSQLRKALTEILMNAIEAMPKDGKLDVKTEMKKDFVTISIADSGTGMSEEVQKKMFEPFFTTKEPTRNGLGATVAYGILKNHGAKIKVFSAPEKGTTFVINLPAHPTPRCKVGNKRSFYS